MTCHSLQAAYYGRLISGGFFSKEVFRNSELDRYNDVAVFSERLFVNFDRISETNTEFTVDIRDKHNLFDKLSSERLKLVSGNKLQLHQFNLHNLSNEGFAYSLGRFPIYEAGAVHVDGLDIGFKNVMWGLNSKFSLFYGLNPELADQSEIKFNTETKTIGGYWTLESKGKDWDNYFYTSSSLVRQSYKTEVDRFYFYNNIAFQDVSGKNLSSVLYLDLEPKINVQNLWLTYLFELSNKYKLRTSVSTIDSLQYSRNQDVRETLPSSKFHQLALSLRSPNLDNNNIFEVKTSYGVRQVDQKNRAEIKLGYSLPKFINEEVSANFNIGLRKDFTLNALMFGGGLIHSNNKREISFTQDIQLEKSEVDSMNYAFITEGSYTKFFSRSLFGIVSLQNIYDKNVSIFSALFKISYRFGEGGQAPIRDGSPPMGAL